ncbi:MAG: hypothetical protein WCF77_04690 [Minisyncoccia bacterium]
MSKHVLKFFVAALLVMAVALVAGLFWGVAYELLAGVCGTIIIVNRYICRCHSCGSWRTKKIKDRLSDDYYPHAVIFEKSRCSRCGVEEPMREYTAFF